MLLWQASDRPLEPMKSKCTIRNSACSSAQAISTNSYPPPALLFTVPAGVQFTFPLTSHWATLTLSSLSVSAGWTDAWESWQRTPPPHDPHSLTHPSAYVTLPLSLSSFYLLQPLIYPVPPLLPLSYLCLSSLSPSLSLHHLQLGCRQCDVTGGSMGLEESSGAKQN